MSIIQKSVEKLRIMIRKIKYQRLMSELKDYKNSKMIL